MGDLRMFDYAGRVYVRPIGRGTVLIDLDGDMQLEDVLPEGYGYLRVEFVAYDSQSEDEENAKLAHAAKHAPAVQGTADSETEA